MQNDLNSIHNWLSSHLLRLNTTKSKYMIFSLKPQPSFDCLPPLNISDSPLERVYSYKYLDLIMNCTLSWTSHIQTTAKKAKRLLGLIFRNFYFHSSSSTLMALYKTVVRPVLEYGCAIWDPVSPSTSYILEGVQFFALKLISKNWNLSYSFLLSLLKMRAKKSSPLL